MCAEYAARPDTGSKNARLGETKAEGAIGKDRDKHKNRTPEAADLEPVAKDGGEIQDEGLIGAEGFRGQQGAVSTAWRIRGQV